MWKKFFKLVQSVISHKEKFHPWLFIAFLTGSSLQVISFPLPENYYQTLQLHWKNKNNKNKKKNEIVCFEPSSGERWWTSSVEGQGSDVDKLCWVSNKWKRRVCITSGIHTGWAHSRKRRGGLMDGNTLCVTLPVLWDSFQCLNTSYCTSSLFPQRKRHSDGSQ